MTDQQRVAITFPCRLAIETMHPRYRQRGAVVTTVLTVNTGYE